MALSICIMVVGFCLGVVSGVQAANDVYRNKAAKDIIEVAESIKKGN